MEFQTHFSLLNKYYWKSIIISVIGKYENITRGHVSNLPPFCILNFRSSNVAKIAGSAFCLSSLFV